MLPCFTQVWQSGSYVLNTSKGKRGHYRTYPSSVTAVKEIDTVCSGDIAAAVGFEEYDNWWLIDGWLKSSWGQSRSEPVIQLMVEPKSSEPRQNGCALQVAERPNIPRWVNVGKLVKQLSLVHGWRLHLDVLVDRMRREFKVEQTSNYLKYLTVKHSALLLQARETPVTIGKSPIRWCMDWILQTKKERLRFEKSYRRWCGSREFIPAVEKGLIGQWRMVSLLATQSLTWKLNTMVHIPRCRLMRAALGLTYHLALKEAAKTAQPAILEPMML